MTKPHKLIKRTNTKRQVNQNNFTTCPETLECQRMLPNTEITTRQEHTRTQGQFCLFALGCRRNARAPPHRPWQNHGALSLLYPSLELTRF